MTMRNIRLDSIGGSSNYGTVSGTWSEVAIPPGGTPASGLIEYNEASPPSGHYRAVTAVTEPGLPPDSQECSLISNGIGA